MQKRFLTLFVLGLSLATALPSQTDPFLGNWKLNAKKSKFDPGPPRKSESRVVVTGPAGMNVSVKRVNGDGTTNEFEYTTNLDGKVYPIIGDAPDGADSVAANLTAFNTMQVSMTKAGKVIGTATILVSRDGKVLTITSKGHHADGKPFNEVAVYDKQ